ncbi:hypothetical protein HYFRA_00008646 [Hymenoscyphus fraxineus]|uniref:Prenylcysteine lyase domain-containing protein n=1 Tax=Hymenoscyphus fraxineus TaxID=746836 RepID=A0A9N9L0S2_9HELO|nr:hypothetical protein HYFRA_00008646 [Hymenoscyphus fraxineus]
MHSGLSLFLVSVLCGQTLGFAWPFTAFAATFANQDTPESESDESGHRSVAIIGAGAGGSATAYYLQQFAAESGIDIDITVFEKESYIGGRTTTVNAYDNHLEPVELGGSIFVEVNEILKNATAKFGLSTEGAITQEFEDIVGIWNGEKFVYTMKDSDSQWWDIAKLVWKYGFAPLKTQRLMQTVVGKFKQIYTAPFFPFRSLSERAQDLDLLSATSLTGEQFLEKNGISGGFTTDIIQASTRVNYGQNLGLIHGLETMVVMAIEGAVSVDGGNWQIFDSMVKHSNATLHLNSTVNSITKTKGRYRLNTTSIDASSEETQRSTAFDTIVLAAPYQYAKINVEEGLLKKVPDTVPYVSLHVTLFTSPHRFSRDFFNLGPDAEIPSTILTTLSPDEVIANPEKGVGKAGFFSISTLRTVINPETLKMESLYKSFSPEPVTPEFLAKLFGTDMPADLSKVTPNSGDAITWYYPHVWNSYPYEYPRVTFEETELAPGFYYTSGMDSFISTMETNALMGMNVARLVVDDYLLVEQAQDEPNLLGQKPLAGENGVEL